MYSLIIGTILLSLLHAIIPNHWLPILAIGRKEGWSLSEVSGVTFVAGFAHVLSTIAIGIILGLLGYQLAINIQYFTRIIAPALLILLGAFFIYRHHRHHHFHLHMKPETKIPRTRIVLTLVIAMFFSPCLEIQAYFLLAGARGFLVVIAVGAIYLVVTVLGMVLWVRAAYTGISKFDWHSIEHKSGNIAGWTLILTGIISFFIF